jgi:hypothetical protein
MLWGKLGDVMGDVYAASASQEVDDQNPAGG